jgi:hypothetical protein
MAASITTNDLPNIAENNLQLLNDIQALQTIEQELFNDLENYSDLTTAQQGKIIQKINSISNMRVNLYQTLGGVNNFFKSALFNSTNTLGEQTKAIEIVERELNKSKKRLELLEAEKNNKIRLVEINNYYGQKYSEHSDLMKNIIYILIPVLLLSVLKNKGILPNNIYYILVIIIAAIGSYFLWTTFMSIINRDSMNYSEYDWYFDANSAPVANPGNGSDPWAGGSGSNFGTCIGQDCCPTGLIYDVSLNQCQVKNSAASTSITTATHTRTIGIAVPTITSSIKTTESFINDVFTKHAINQNKPDVILGGDDVKPMNSSIFW